MANKPILPGHGSHKADEDDLKHHASTAGKIADKIVVSYLTSYFRAVTKILTVEDQGLDFSLKQESKSNAKNAKKPPHQ